MPLASIRWLGRAAPLRGRPTCPISVGLLRNRLPREFTREYGGGAEPPPTPPPPPHGSARRSRLSALLLRGATGEEEDMALLASRHSFPSPLYNGQGSKINPGSEPAGEQVMRRLRSSRVLDLPLPELLHHFRDDPDMATWACLLEIARERSGDRGVSAVFDAVYSRKLLWTVTGRSAELVWDQVLEWAIGDSRGLSRVRRYAFWMWVIHRVRWPNLYVRVMAELLRTGRYGEAREHHTVLKTGELGADDDLPPGDGDWEERAALAGGRYMPDAASMTAVIKQFIRDPAADLQAALQLIYSDQAHRTMYDQLLPFLYESGLSAPALVWRRLLIRHGDLPHSHHHVSPSRSFVRFIHAYYPETRLTPEEKTAADLPEGFPADQPDADRKTKESTSGVAEEGPLGAEDGRGSARRDDASCARWFATGVIPVEMSISGLKLFKLDEIGPLTLQSIGVREKKASRIADRIRQLDSLGIGLGSSTYSRALRILAEAGKDDVIADLLQSDIHPDVFDDMVKVGQIIAASVVAGEWRRCRLLMSVRLAVAEDSTSAVLNEILMSVARRGPGYAIGVLEDMEATGVGVSGHGLRFLCEECVGVLSNRVDPRVKNREFVCGVARLCCKLSRMSRPVPAWCWRLVLTRLGQLGCLDDLERLCVDIMNIYQPPDRHGSGALILVHELDLPGTGRPWDSSIPVLPADFPASHARHPLRKIFTAALARAMVRWGFQRTITRPQSYGSVLGRSSCPADYDLARGARLVQVLISRGLHIQHIDDIVRRAVVIRLASLRLGRCRPASWRHGGQLSIRHARQLFNRAWGSDLLPDVPDLEEMVSRAALKREAIEQKRAARVSETLTEGDLAGKQIPTRRGSRPVPLRKLIGVWEMRHKAGKRQHGEAG